MLAAAESRHIVSVCQSLAEADKVGFDSVIMVGAGYIKMCIRDRYPVYGWV